MTTSTPAPRNRLAGAIRVVSALVVIGSAVAVTGLTADRNDQVAVVIPQAQVANATAPAAAAPVPPPAAAPTPAPGAPNSAVTIKPGNTSPSVPLAQAKPGTPAAPGAPAKPVSPGTPITPGSPGESVPIGTTPGTASPFDASPLATQPPCPLGWPAAERQGGLASLIGLAPMAGAFSSEAFALGSVYQPLLQLVGPVLAEIAPVISQYEPVLAPIITNVQGITAVVLEAILPYYGPYRAQLIAAEGELAKVLTPILDRVYNSEAASCFTAWQGQIISAAKGGKITVASLARPGTVVELG